jgi:uncharacterized protein (DUF2267 family)
MDYRYFLTAVEQRTGIPRDRAEPIVCFTLYTLAERISAGQADDLARRLPPELRPCMRHDGQRATFHLYEFLRRISKEMGTDRATATRMARAVLATLWTAVGPKEFADMQAQLPGDFLPLLDAAVAEAPPRAREDEPPFVGTLTLDEFLDRVAERAGLDRDRARRATAAVLEMLAMRVTAGQIDDLRPSLPYELRPALDRGMTRSDGRAVPLSLGAFVEEITRREGVSRDEAAAHAQAVLSVLREAVGEKEFSDTAAQLPAEYRTLLPQR